MPSTKVKHSTVKYKATFWSQKQRFLKWQYWGMRENLGIEDLLISWVGGGAKPLHVQGATTSLKIARTIEGASTITLSVLDPHGHILSEKANRGFRQTTKGVNPSMALTDQNGKPLDAPTLQQRAIEIVLDDVPFRLTKIGGDLLDGYTLTFEDRGVFWMRHKKGALSSSRADVTRAQFILKMFREIKTESIPFICPQLSRSQPIKKSEEAEMGLAELFAVTVLVDPPSPDVFDESRTRMPKDTDKDAPKKKKRITTSDRLTIKGKTANHEQISNMNEMMEAAYDEKGATDRSVKSAVVTVITETLAYNKEEGTSTSTGMFQLLASTARTFGVDPMDIAGCTHLYMTKGFTGQGGAISLCKAHPDWPVYRIAQAVQGSGAGRATNGRANYGQWVDEAQKWIDAFKGRGGGSDITGGSYRKSYQYQRDKDENSWECGLRLADEVRWRLFPVGRAFFFDSETDLFRREISEVVRKGDPRILDLPWEMDWNKPVNEFTFRVMLKSWEGYPGSTIMFDGYGAPDGRWLVTDLERDWFEPEADITVKQPLAPLKEPAAEIGKTTTGVSGEGTGGEIGRLYQAALHISNWGKPYTWGGGHGVPMDSIGPQGLDCSSSTSLALYRADLWDTKKNGNMAYVSGDFDRWGAPGSGHLFTVMYNSTHVWIQFEQAAGMMYKRFDTSHPDGGTGMSSERGPRMRKSSRNDQDRFQKRHWPGM